MFLEIIGLVVFVVFAIMFAIFWFDFKSGNGKLPEAFIQAKKNGTIDPKLIRIFKSYPDKQRFMLFWLQVKRIQACKLDGDLAELGVYKGDTAQILHLMAPEKRIHLFDTFTGFDEADLINEKGEAATYTPQHFADTSLEKVKTKLGHSELIHYYPGNFSDQSTRLSDQKFCLASLDADLAKPTAEGLRFFYDRLVPAGLLIVHDYNQKWPALMEAVNEFVKQIPENPVLIPDKDTSLVIVKNST
ncbi:MAG: macrocin O-methyltransferase [Bacteroidales bacterium]|jgi:O-methyltransferase|nr:macrocin O-methyltransferase [Bacteroidales bacterium]HOI31276.1 TylF/MycF/NovP-related O-methyltransferase [Bacteroidales bacterium]